MGACRVQLDIREELGRRDAAHDNVAPFPSAGIDTLQVAQSEYTVERR